MQSLKLIRTRCCQGLLTIMFSATASAAPLPWDALDAGTLDGARGGFTLPAGLQLSLGLERMVTINGAMLAHSRLDLAGSAHGLTGTQSAGTAGMLIQSGDANLAPRGLLAGMHGATLIQNSLNDRHIDSRTIIHATVNSHALLDSLNFHAQLNEALARAALAP